MIEAFRAARSEDDGYEYGGRPADEKYIDAAAQLCLEACVSPEDWVASIFANWKPMWRRPVQAASLCSEMGMGLALEGAPRVEDTPICTHLRSVAVQNDRHAVQVMVDGGMPRSLAVLTEEHCRTPEFLAEECRDLTINPGQITNPETQRIVYELLSSDGR